MTTVEQTSPRMLRLQLLAGVVQKDVLWKISAESLHRLLCYDRDGLPIVVASMVRRDPELTLALVKAARERLSGGQQRNVLWQKYLGGRKTCEAAFGKSLMKDGWEEFEPVDERIKAVFGEWIMDIPEHLDDKDMVPYPTYTSEDSSRNSYLALLNRL